MLQRKPQSLWVAALAGSALLALATLAAPAMADHGDSGRNTVGHGSRKAVYRQTNLVSDIAGVAMNTDPNLVNPWGIAINPRGPIWIANNHSGTSTVYDGDGNPLPSEASPLIVAIPPPAGSPAGTVGAATGTVFSGGSDFVVASNGHSGPSRFLFATEDGTVSGWSPAADPTNAILGFTSTDGAIYKGLALVSTPAGSRLYLADFHNAKVDVLDGHFAPVSMPGSFMDPNIPAGFAPFNIVSQGNLLMVTYAKQDANAEDDEPGPGQGYVDLYDLNGNLVRRFASNGALNAPWGVALAPRGFGALSGALLIGNFGDGRINAYDPRTGAALGPVSDARGRPITISGLWGLSFAPNASGKGHDFGEEDNAVLYFTAGLADEEHGLFGKIESGR